MTGTGWSRRTDSRHGPDENQRWASIAGATTMIMVPSINRTARDAADYVEYMNHPADGDRSNPNGGVDWAEVRAANGHPEPYRISVLEYGNEPYLPNQRYWRSTDPQVKVQQFIDGGWARQTADSPRYEDNDGLFLGCDLKTRRTGTGQPGQTYRTRYSPIAMPGDEVGHPGVGDGAITAPVLRVDGEVWTMVESFDGQPAGAKVYTVNSAQGTVQFGDASSAVAVPPEGAELAIEYTTISDGLVAVAAAMKDVDPTISVCAGWGKPEFIEAMGSRPYDCLGVHSYTTPPDDGTPLRYHNLQRAAGNKSADLARYREAMAGHFPDAAQRPELIVTEYGTLNVPIRDYGATLAFTLYHADLVIGQLENDVQISTMSNHNGGPHTDPDRRNGSLFGGAPLFNLSGRALVLQLVARMVGGHVTTTTLAGVPRLQAATGDYDALRVVSSCTGGTSRVMVVNRDPQRSIPATVRISGADSAQTVQVTTLNGPGVAAMNTGNHPGVISTSTQVRRVHRPELTESFEPHSVTLLEFRAVRGAECAR